MSARSGPQPPPIPPVVGSRLSGVLEAGVGWGEAPWVWEDDQVHAEQSGPSVWEEKCTEPHTTVGKNSCFYYAILARGPTPGPTPDTALSCLEQWPPAGFCRVSPCSGARRAQGRQPCPLGLHCRRSPGTSSSRQQPRLPPPPRPAEASSHTESSAHALDCPTEHQLGSWPALSHSRAAVR